MVAISDVNIGPLRGLLQSRIRSRENELARLRGALADVDATERLLRFIQRDPSLERQVNLPGPKTEIQFSAENPFRPYTNKAVIWEVLDLSPSAWLTTAEVQQQATMVMGRAVPLSSISTTLTDLTPRTVTRRGKFVALTRRVQDEPKPSNDAA